ncbi:conserved hypothetical protein [Culex quinquefasciatus]|uniref:Uncharacterized protein n=1 Tax=Culex quinquefasciatus TaxID=7176 RepID=B0XF17_CULQU|nr:conserved hypothetical protein [Culex quinquefasciatus]|eukprot:XP_001868239.1 conserved hypothetical protein [Culex quinquefasciatus]
MAILAGLATPGVAIALSEDRAAAQQSMQAAEDELNVEVEGEDAPLHSVESGSQFGLPAGYPFELLVGFDNKGSDDFITETVQASFRYTIDFNYIIQNFSTIANNREIKPGHEATISYSFPSESFAGRPVFDPAKNRYGTYQASFQETLNSMRPEVKVKREIRLSSAGLIHTYFGEEVNRKILERNSIANPEKELVRGVYRKLYDTLIAELDGIDNGVPMQGPPGIDSRCTLPDPEILEQENFCPWKEHLYELEGEHGIGGLPNEATQKPLSSRNNNCTATAAGGVPEGDEKGAVESDKDDDGILDADVEVYLTEDWQSKKIVTQNSNQSSGSRKSLTMRRKIRTKRLNRICKVCDACTERINSRLYKCV